MHAMSAKMPEFYRSMVKSTCQLKGKGDQEAVPCLVHVEHPYFGAGLKTLDGHRSTEGGVEQTKQRKQSLNISCMWENGCKSDTHADEIAGIALILLLIEG